MGKDSGKVSSSLMCIGVQSCAKMVNTQMIFIRCYNNGIKNVLP